MSEDLNADLTKDVGPLDLLACALYNGWHAEGYDLQCHPLSVGQLKNLRSTCGLPPGWDPRKVPLLFSHDRFIRDLCVIYDVRSVPLQLRITFNPESIRYFETALNPFRHARLQDTVRAVWRGSSDGEDADESSCQLRHHSTHEFFLRLTQTLIDEGHCGIDELLLIHFDHEIWVAQDFKKRFPRFTSRLGTFFNPCRVTKGFADALSHWQNDRNDASNFHQLIVEHMHHRNVDANLSLGFLRLDPQLSTAFIERWFGQKADEQREFVVSRIDINGIGSRLCFTEM